MKRTKYKVYKLIQGEWYYQGSFFNVKYLAQSCFIMGKEYASVEDIRVETEEVDMTYTEVMQGENK